MGALEDTGMDAIARIGARDSAGLRYSLPWRDTNIKTPPAKLPLSKHTADWSARAVPQAV